MAVIISHIGIAPLRWTDFIGAAFALICCWYFRETSPLISRDKPDSFPPRGSLLEAALPSKCKLSGMISQIITAYCATMEAFPQTGEGAERQRSG